MNSLRVLECSEGVAAAYCGKLLAETGFEVARGHRSLPDDLDLYLNSGKSLVDTRGIDRLAPLADVIVTDRPDTFTGAPGLVARITPFGRTGPYASFAGTEIAVQALGGLLYLTGTPDREPVMIPGHQAAYLAGTSTALAIMAALHSGHSAGERIDVSLMETVASVLEATLMMPQYRGEVRERCGSGLPEAGPCTEIYRTSDGHVGIAAQTIPQWQALALLMGRPELADDPRFATFAEHVRHADDLADELRSWFASVTTDEAFHQAQLLRIPVGPVVSLAGVLDDPQLTATGTWRTLEGTGLRLPGRPFLVDGEPSGPASVPPPAAVQSDELAGRWQATPPPIRPPARRRGPPLAGVRVIDLTAAWAGPLAAGLLADLGAEVIKVEAGVRPDMTRFATRHEAGRGKPWDIGGWFHQLNRNKLGIALDLRTEEARGLLLDLIRVSDVVVENFSRRVMGNFGLAYERLAEANPRLVMVSMPGFGDRGPYQDYVSFGEIIEPMAGLSSLTGYRDGPPLNSPIALGDPASGMHAAFATVEALLRREETGRGCHIVLSHLQALTRFLGAELLAAQRGLPPGRLGSRDRDFAPQGVFPCRGANRWIAIAVRDDREWQALAETLGDPALAANPAFATAAGRLEHQDEVERRVAALTRLRDDLELMRALQARGVSAGAVLDGARLLADPHLKARGFFAPVRQPGIGRVLLPGPPWRLEAARPRIRRRAPRLGEHTDEVLRRLLGLNAERLARLRREGVTSAAVPLTGL